MKSFLLFALIIAIIFAFVPLIEGYKIWIHNKLTAGTRAQVTATRPDKNTDPAYALDFEWSTAHDGFHLEVRNDFPTYWLVFFVEGSFQDAKWRGPIENNKDYCWHFHGDVFNWLLWEC